MPNKTIEGRKSCPRCKVVKPLSGFSVFSIHNESKPTSHCKQCMAEYSREHYRRKKEYYQQKDALYKKSLKYKEVKKKAAQNQMSKFPEKFEARTKFRKELNAGRIKKENCSIGHNCEGRIEAHHPDYSKPLDVIWFCQKHHKEHHYPLPPTNKQN